MDSAKRQFELICTAIASLEYHVDKVGHSSNRQTEAVQQASTTVGEFQNSFAGTRKLATSCHKTGHDLSVQAAKLDPESKETEKLNAA